MTPVFIPMQEIPIRSFAVSVVVLREGEAGCEVLLLRRARTLAGLWCQVAGKLEPGETAWQAALREVREETGLELARLYSADVCEQFYEPDRNSISIIPVFVGFVRAGAIVHLNDEHSEFRWVSFDEAIKMVSFAGQRTVLRHIHDEFVARVPTAALLIRDSPGGDAQPGASSPRQAR